MKRKDKSNHQMDWDSTFVDKDEQHVDGHAKDFWMSLINLSQYFCFGRWMIVKIPPKTKVQQLPSHPQKNAMDTNVINKYQPPWNLWVNRWPKALHTGCNKCVLLLLRWDNSNHIHQFNRNSLHQATNRLGQDQSIFSFEEPKEDTSVRKRCECFSMV